MKKRTEHPRWCAPPCTTDPIRPANAHRSRVLAVASDHRAENIRINAFLMKRNYVPDAPVNLVLDAYDDEIDAERPRVVLVLSIKQACDLERAIRGLLRSVHLDAKLGSALLDDDAPEEAAGRLTALVGARRAMSNEEIDRFLRSGELPNLSQPVDES